MTNFPMLPNSSPRTVTATPVHADGTTDTGYSPAITYSVDKPSLISIQDKAGNAGIPYNQVIVAPVLPGANSGGVATVTASSIDENNNPISSSFTVTVSVNPNPAVGFMFA